MAQRGRKIVSDYLNEEVMYGGLPATRADVIRDLEAKGIPQKGINFFLAGIDRRIELNNNRKGEQ